MITLQLRVDLIQLKGAAAVRALRQAAGILRAGGLVALPTETVYGLAANAFDARAVSRIFAAKRRPDWDPVIVHIAPLGSREAMLDGLVERADVDDRARRLMNAFWPGPLTLLLPRTRAVPDVVTAGRPLVGVRMPSHPVALELIRVAELPLAAPSANLFGHISPTSAAHVLEDLDGRIDAVLDAGPTGYGVESTVLDPGQNPMVIYRPGAVTAEEIREIAGPVEMYREPEPKAATSAGVGLPTRNAGLPSPGVGLRHYAPRARLILLDAPPAGLSAQMAAAAEAWDAHTVGVMLPGGVAAPPGIAANRIYAWGRWDAPEELAHELYAGLRALDAEGCQVILCPLPPEEGIGAALRDRLRKASREM